MCIAIQGDKAAANCGCLFVVWVFFTVGNMYSFTRGNRIVLLFLVKAIRQFNCYC